MKRMKTPGMRLSGIMLLVLILALLGGCDMPGAQKTPAIDTPTPGAPVPAAPATAAHPEKPAESAPPPAAAPEAKSQLQIVKERGYLICGVNGTLPGFSLRNADGSYTGFDVDFCRAVAVAIFKDREKVEFVDLSASERFEALKSGRVDVLFRNTTWTIDRDATVGVDFGPVIFHDGQGFMVRRDRNISLLEELAGLRICVRRGTTHETNLPDKMATYGIPYTPVLFDDENEQYAAYISGQCDAITSDRSSLVARRTTFDNPGDHVTLAALISREPLSPAYRENDSIWAAVVRTVCYSLVYAEELGITSANVEEKANITDLQTLRLLGVVGTVGTDLGLSNDFARNIVRQVGNYEEVYLRNLGPETPINLDRGPNKAWNKGEGGLLWSPTW